MRHLQGPTGNWFRDSMNHKSCTMPYRGKGRRSEKFISKVLNNPRIWRHPWCTSSNYKARCNITIWIYGMVKDDTFEPLAVMLRSLDTLASEGHLADCLYWQLKAMLMAGYLDSWRPFWVSYPHANGLIPSDAGWLEFIISRALLFGNCIYWSMG